MQTFVLDMKEMKGAAWRDRRIGYILAVLFLLTGVGGIWRGASGIGMYYERVRFQYTAKETLVIGIVFVIGGAYWLWTLIRTRKTNKRMKVTSL